MQSHFTARACVGLVLAGLALGAAACSSDKATNPNPTTLNFVGTVNGANGSLSGSITIVIVGANVTGSFAIVSPAASSHALTGTYNSGSKALTASGDGYNFAGSYDGSSHLDGNMSGAGSGVFVASRDDNNAALAFCGSFAGSDDGVWNFTVVGSSLHGTATTSSGTVIPLDGTMSGSSISVANPQGGGALATGTRSGNSASGSWNTGVNSGTWTGAKCN